jgi:4-amino-4-deoxy-L-arabinose transferase
MNNDPARAASARLPLWLPALLLLIAFAFQGSRGIWEPDEGRYSSAGINMHESGDWLVPTVDGEHPHLTKPPLTYWALASSFTLLGHNEWAARLPSALAFVGTGLFVFGLGRRLCPARPWLPAVVWATSLAPAIASNVVSTDPLLVLFETMAMFGFVEAWSRTGPDARRWYVLMWLGWGLAFLTKGPPGLLPLFAMVAFLAVHDRSRLKQMFPVVGLLLFAVVAFTWFALVIAQQPDRLKYFLGYEVYDRVFTATHNRNAEWYGAFAVYVPMLLLGTLPWWPLALTAASGPRAAWRRLRTQVGARQPDTLLLLWWLLLPLTIFFLARSRLELYVLPLFVPLALIMSRALAGWIGTRRLAWVAGVATAVFIALKGVAAQWPVDRDARDIARHLSSIVDPASIDGIVFVGMRPYYGLNVYLDVPVEGVEIGERRFEYSRFVAPDNVCEEVHMPERNVYAVRTSRAAAFEAAVLKCGSAARRIGELRADGHDVLLFVVPPATP